MVCAIICFSLSSTFHLVLSYSERVAKFFSRLDYSGISILIAGSTVPPILYGFACSSSVKYTYLILIITACVFSFVVTLLPNSNTPKYRRLRGALFIAVGLFAGLPTFHAALSDDKNILIKLFYWALGGATYISGALLYVARVPERCSPGTFDYFVLFIISIGKKP